MYEIKHFYYNIFTIIVIFCAQILLCIAQQNTLQSSTTLDKSTAELITSKIAAKEIDLSTELFSHLNIYQTPAPVQQSPEHISKASSIACYECNSHKDPDCITKPEKFKKNCTNVNKGSDYVGCRKIDQWVDYDGGEDMKAHHRVIRQCAQEGDISKPCYYRAGFGGRINACFCDKDLCNSAFPLKNVYFHFLLFIISSLFVVFHSNKL